MWVCDIHIYMPCSCTMHEPEAAHMHLHSRSFRVQGFGHEPSLQLPIAMGRSPKHIRAWALTKDDRPAQRCGHAPPAEASRPFCLRRAWTFSPTWRQKTKFWPDYYCNPCICNRWPHTQHSHPLVLTFWEPPQHNTTPARSVPHY